MEITSKSMRSTKTRHYAVPLDSREPYGKWCVTWLANTTLRRDQATTAMVLAETVGRGLPKGDPRWRHIDNWARELGLTGTDVANRVSQPLTREWWL